MYRVIIPKKAQKDLNKIPNEYRQKIIIAFSVLSLDPFVGKKMRGDCDGQYTYRVWPYRIIYEIYKKELLILVLAVGHRQGIYNK